MHPTLIAEYLCSRQPLPVRARLIQDEEFGARFGLRPQTVITVGGTLTVDQNDVLVAARRALLEQQEQRLVDLKGAEIVLTPNDSTIILRRADDSEEVLEVQLPELTILSPRSDERTQALDQLLDQFGPAAPDFSKVRQVTEKRPLSDVEAGDLLAERYGGVAALQARAAAALEGNTARLVDLIPDALGYYECFCGPDPVAAGNEEYLGAILPSYRKELLNRNLAKGLDICLLGALRDDLMPGAWTQHLRDDELWDALSACDAARDPMSLLGALDIALYRLHDQRYQAFAEDAVKKLVRDEFRRPDGTDHYELFPIFAELVLDCINSLEGGATREPFWKRMCAWMQSGFLARMALHKKLDLDRMREWAASNQTAAGRYATIVDFRREPMYLSGAISREAFRAEVVGRLAVMRSRHEAEGRANPQSDDISDAISRLTERGMPLGWQLPGPLEGHMRPAGYPGRRLPEETVREAKRALGTDLKGQNWHMLAYFSQRFDLGEDLLLCAREDCAEMTFNDDESQRDEQLNRLMHMCAVAAAQRDADLGQAIANKAVESAVRAHPDDVSVILQVLLFASAALENETNWAEWLEARLADFAARVPAGQASRKLLWHLSELKKILDLKFAIQARAEALASAAT